MKKMKSSQLFLAFLFLTIGCSTLSQNKNILTRLNTIELPNVEGRIDHMSIDIKSGRLFIAALGNGSIEIIDLKTKKDIASLKGLEEPQGIIYYPPDNLLFVASGGDGTCKIYNASNFNLIKTINFGDDADNIRYDKKRDIVFVGYGSGGIAAIDPLKAKLLYKIDLPAHPESFQIDESNGLMFVNIPDARQLAVIKIEERKIVQKIKLDVRGNFPMAIDSTNHIIFIGSRNPSRLVLYNTNSLKKISDKNISGDADDIFYDKSDSLIFVSCGSGDMDIFKQMNSKEIVQIVSVKTSPGARTSLFVPELKKLFVAARKYDKNNAKVFEYLIKH